MQREIQSYKAIDPPQEFAKYFNRQWMATIARWALAYRKSTDADLRTNNIAEAGNKTLKSLVPHPKMSIPELFPFLRHQLDFAAKEGPRILKGIVRAKPPPREAPTTIALNAEVSNTDSLRLVCDSFKTKSQPVLPGIATVPRVRTPTKPMKPIAFNKFADYSVSMMVLESMGMRADDVLADGNCVFHAYSKCVGWLSHHLMRLAICDHISRDWDFFSLLVPERFTNDMLAYLAYMRTDANYG